MKRMLKDKYDDLMGKRAKATPLKARGHRRRRRRDDDEPHPVQPLRYRRSNRHRRRLYELDLMPAARRRPVPARVRAALPRQGLLARQDPRRRIRGLLSKYRDRLCLIDGERRYTYVELDAATDNLALNLLELGLKPLDRVVPRCRTSPEFVLLYFALQKIGAIPIAALVTHRFAEINQFVQLSGARCASIPSARATSSSSR